MCILAVVGVAPMPMSRDGVAPASCQRSPARRNVGWNSRASLCVYSPTQLCPVPWRNEMTTNTIDESQRKAARVAGFFYLLTFAIVVVVNFGINERLMVAGNPAQTAHN